MRRPQQPGGAFAFAQFELNIGANLVGRVVVQPFRASNHRKPRHYRPPADPAAAAPASDRRAAPLSGRPTAAADQAASQPPRLGQPVVGNVSAAGGYSP